MIYLTFLQSLPIISLPLVAAGILFRKSIAKWTLFPYISTTLFLYLYLTLRLGSGIDLASPLPDPGSALLQITILLFSLGGIYLLRKRPIPAAFFTFLLLFIYGFFRHLPGLNHFVAPVGFSYLIFRAHDGLSEKSRSANHGNVIPNAGEQKETSLPYLLLQLFAFPVILMGPVLMRGDFRIRTRPFSIRSAFYRRAILLLVLGYIKLYLFMPILEARFQTAILHPFQINGAGLSNLLHSGLYYYIHLYLEFSGVTDLAVGYAGLLGLKIRHNFRTPYLATSLSDFWRRWHVTLSFWVRKHLYIPLGGNRVPRWKHLRNLMASMLLIGLWHGAELRYFVWGLLHGFWLGLERYILLPIYGRMEGRTPRLGRVVRYAITQIFLIVTWSIFFWN